MAFDLGPGISVFRSIVPTQPLLPLAPGRLPERPGGRQRGPCHHGAVAEAVRSKLAEVGAPVVALHPPT
jgi:hypothetical protein